MCNSNSNSNQYITIIISVLLSGLVSCGTAFFTTSYQTEQIIKQKTYENKISAYNEFLSKINNEKYSKINSLFLINKMLDNLTVDESIQKIEDSIFLLSKEQEFLYILDNHLKILSLYGSEKVKIYCSDILSVYLDNEYSVNWDYHSEFVRNTRDDWVNNDGVIIGWERKVTDETRAKFAIISRQYAELINQLSIELKEGI